MLVARGNAVLDRSAVRVGFAFGRGIWCKLIDQERVAYDTRYLPGAPGAPKPRVCLYLIVAGTLELHRHVVDRFEAPSAVTLTLEQLEGARDRRELTLRASGEHCSVIEIHLDSALLSRKTSLPGRLALPTSVWTRAKAAIERFNDDELQTETELVEMLRELAANGILDEDAVTRATAPMPALVVQLWRGLKPLVERRLLSATAGEIAEGAGVTTRRVEHGMQYFIANTGLLGSGIRGVMNRLRLKAAVIFLSGDDGSITEVARISGFGSADAIARAFRDAGLPSPSVVRQALANANANANANEAPS